MLHQTRERAQTEHPLMRRLGLAISGAPCLLLVAPLLVAVPLLFLAGYYVYM